MAALQLMVSHGVTATAVVPAMVEDMAQVAGLLPGPETASSSLGFGAAAQPGAVALPSLRMLLVGAGGMAPHTQVSGGVVDRTTLEHAVQRGAAMRCPQLLRAAFAWRWPSMGAFWPHCHARLVLTNAWAAVG